MDSNQQMNGRYVIGVAIMDTEIVTGASEKGPWAKFTTTVKAGDGLYSITQFGRTRDDKFTPGDDPADRDPIHRVKAGQRVVFLEWPARPKELKGNYGVRAITEVRGEVLEVK
jgi:hypothetical protein